MFDSSRMQNDPKCFTKCLVWIVLKSLVSKTKIFPKNLVSNMKCFTTSLVPNTKRWIESLLKVFPRKQNVSLKVLSWIHHDLLKVSFQDSIKCFSKNLVWNYDVSQEGFSQIQNVSLKVLSQIQNVELKVYWKSSLENKMFHWSLVLNTSWFGFEIA